MAYVVTFGGVNVPVDKDTLVRLEDETGGQDVRSFAGGLRSTVRWTKKGWEFETPALSAAAQATILSAIGVGVTVNGPINNSVAITCTVRCLNGPYRKSWTDVKRRLKFRVREE